MSLGLVRAGKYGEREQVALEEGFVTIGWEELPDLSNYDTREKIAKLVREVDPSLTKN